MGLAERISQTQAETRIKAQEAKEEAERKSQEAEKLKLLETALAIEREIERKTAHITQLASLIEVVGAKKQLEEVQKAWKAGTIDDVPSFHLYDKSFDTKSFVYDKHMSRYPLTNLDHVCMALALRYRYAAFGAAYGGWDNGDGGIVGNVDERVGTYIYEQEVALFVITRLSSGTPFVCAGYGEFNLGVTYYGGGTASSRKPYKSSLLRICTEPETIFPENPNLSRAILEKQLFEVCTKISNPLDLEKDAKALIDTDPYFLGFKNFKSPPWYKRFFS